MVLQSTVTLLDLAILCRGGNQGGTPPPPIPCLSSLLKMYVLGIVLQQGQSTRPFLNSAQYPNLGCSPSATRPGVTTAPCHWVPHPWEHYLTFLPSEFLTTCRSTPPARVYPGSFDKINTGRYVKNHYISDFFLLKCISFSHLLKAPNPWDIQLLQEA